MGPLGTSEWELPQIQRIILLHIADSISEIILSTLTVEGGGLVLKQTSVMPLSVNVPTGSQISLVSDFHSQMSP